MRSGTITITAGELSETISVYQSGYSNGDEKSTVVLNPLDDAYIRGGTYSGTNYGSETELIVKRGSDSNFFRKSYVKFDLSGLETGNVTNAVLRLYANKANSCMITAFETTDNWDESTLSWDNAPIEGNALDAVELSASGQYYEWDITSYVNAQSSEDGVVSIILYDAASSNTQIVFNSKEVGDNLPELEIVYEYVLSEPNVPGDLTAIGRSSSQIELKWVDSASNEDSIIIERSLNGLDNWVKIASLAENTTSFVDAGLIASQTYFYRIYAVNSAGRSNYTEIVSATAETSTGINLSDKISEIILYPNPVNGILYVKSVNKDYTNFILFDMNGHKIKEGKINSNKIDLTSFDLRGVFILRLLGANVKAVNKSIVLN